MMRVGRPTSCVLLEGVMANLSSVLAQAAAEHGERPAVLLDGLVLSYSGLRDAAGRATALLQALGVAAGDRVAIMLPNVPAFPIAFYGALGAGAIVVPMNPLLKRREVA
jgi:long-chain acyl-CoA synthetase